MPLTLVERERALGEMDSGKAPRIDGKPAEFYLEFWDLVGPELLNVIQKLLRTGVMPLSLRRAVVSLLPEWGDLRWMENWRPVSILCTDDKLFSKAVANRLKKVIGDLVLPDQTFCIPGRSIYDNIFFVRDLMDAWHNQNDWNIFSGLGKSV